MSVTTVTLYARDESLWGRARKLAGSNGLSSLVDRALRQYVDQQEPVPGERTRRLVLPLTTTGEQDDMGQSIEFQGQLVVDSEGFSLEQIPRVRVYRTVKRRLVVYRTWPPNFGVDPVYSVYSDLESLQRAPTALSTTWITEEDMLGEHADLTPELARALRSSLGRQPTIAIDELEPSDIERAHRQTIQLKRDAPKVRRALSGRTDQDVLLVAMHLLSATPKAPRHLSEIEEAFAQIKPVSRLGNTPEALKDLQAAMRGYLNNDARKREPARRLFTNVKRGYWALSSIGDRRAIDVLHQFGMGRA